MLRALSRWFVTAADDSARRGSSERVVVESYPPVAFAHRRAWSSRLGDWLAGSSWLASGITPPSSFGRRARREAVAAARLDFAEALYDVRTDGAADALDRITVTRSLHELWYFRAEVFSRVAECHDQAEATLPAGSDRSPFPAPDASRAGANKQRRRATLRAALRLRRRSRRPAAARRGSRSLPSSTPLWRSSAYVVVTWKKKFGSAKCLRYDSPVIVIAPVRRGSEISRASLPVDLRRRDRLQVVDRLLDALAQLVEGLLVVGELSAPRRRQGARRSTWRCRRRSGSASATPACRARGAPPDRRTSSKFFWCACASALSSQPTRLPSMRTKIGTLAECMVSAIESPCEEQRHDRNGRRMRVHNRPFGSRRRRDAGPVQ